MVKELIKTFCYNCIHFSDKGKTKYNCFHAGFCPVHPQSKSLNINQRLENKFQKIAFTRRNCNCK